MARVKRNFKVVSSLPATLQPDSVYYVRVGTGFDIVITNKSGVIVPYNLNNHTKSSAGLYDVDIDGTRYIGLGTPSTLSGSTTNESGEGTHTHELDIASNEDATNINDNSSLMTPSSTQAAIQSHKILETVTFHVGPEQELTTISDALERCSELIQTYKKSSPHITIFLDSGFVMEEQVIIDHGVNLSNVTITSVAPIVINRESLTTTIEGYFPAFAGIHFAKLPRIDVAFMMNTTGSSVNRVGVLVSDGASGWLNEGKGIVGAPYGAIVMDSSNFVCKNSILENSPHTGLHVTGASIVCAEGLNASQAGVYGIHIKNSSSVDYEGADTTNAGVEGVLIEFDVDDYGEY